MLDARRGGAWRFERDVYTQTALATWCGPAIFEDDADSLQEEALAFFETGRGSARASACAIWLAAGICSASAADPEPDHSPPPGGLDPREIIQMVAITFGDNYGLVDSRSVGGVPQIVDFLKGKSNPPGAGNRDNFDGAPARVTFFNTTLYMAPPSQTLIGGVAGQDQDRLNLYAWRDARKAGHEMASLTVRHLNGGAAGHGEAECCRPRNWTAAEWAIEIGASTAMLLETPGTGAAIGEVRGFRAPYLSVNDALFEVLPIMGYTYDSSLPNCFADHEDASNCSWPHRLDAGSADLKVVSEKFSGARQAIPTVGPHKDLWEVPVTTLVVPPDEVAQQYAFRPGLRQRIAARGPMRYPSIYEESTGKIVGLDYTLLMDAGVSGEEMRAILEYNLDQHLEGNRAPLVFGAHAQLYAFSSAAANPDTPLLSMRDERWKGLTDFIYYALRKPEVRLVGTGDVIDWIERAERRER